MRFLSPSCLALLLGCVSLLIPAARGQENNAARVWKDKTGKFRVEATLESVTADQVTIRRRDDGKTVTVPIKSLSDSDVEYLKKNSPELFESPNAKLPTTADKLEALALRRRYAIDSLSTYNRFLADNKVDAAEKAKAEKLREKWLALANANKVRVGRKWYTQAEFDDLVKDELALLEKAGEFSHVSDVATVEKQLKQAAALNPSSVRGDFYLGILYALVARSPADAEDSFSACIRRMLDYEEDLTDAEMANLAVCYNNLALANIRQKQWMEAMRAWERCIAAAPASDLVLHNLGYLQALSKQLNLVSLQSGEAARLDRLCSSVRGIGKAYDPKRGWRYMVLGKTRPEADQDTNTSTRASASTTMPTGNMVLLGGGTGFVVGPGYIVTNRHVVENGIIFYVRGDGGEAVKAEPARLVAVSPDRRVDLAVLQCEAVTAPPLSFSGDGPRLSTEIRTLGFPQFADLGTNIKVTSGIVTALPPHRGLFESSLEECVMHDAIINKGCSGGPLCDRNGLVIGVNAARHWEFEYSFAIPSQKAVPFLTRHVPTLQVASAAGDGGRPWEDVVEQVRRSTVQVLAYTRPDRYNPTLRVSQVTKSDSYEDVACMLCNGRSVLDCPVRGCVDGGLASFRTDSIRFPDGSIHARKVPIRVKCDACNGKGTVDCDQCNRGVDRRFSR